MGILVIDNVDPQDTAFNDPLRDYVSSRAKVTTVNYRNVPPAGELNARYAAVIISGAPLHYSNDTIDSRLSFMGWVQEVTVPVLGICLGHQNLSRLFGGMMIVDEEQENGECSLVVLQDDPLLEAIQTGSEVRELHRVSVTLPGRFQQLARTEVCQNQVMKHVDKPIYGVQFHPELSDTGYIILGNFINLLA